MATMVTEQQALLIATAFLQYKFVVDKLTGSGSSPQFFVISPEAPKQIGRGFVYTAVPDVAIETDDPNDPNDPKYRDRTMSVVVCTSSSSLDKGPMPFREAFWMPKLTVVELTDGITVDDLWSRHYQAREAESEYRLA